MTTALKRFAETLDEIGRPEMVSPDCPYCENPTGGRMVEYGGSHLHAECYDRFRAEMEMAFPDEVQPLDPELFDCFVSDCDPDHEWEWGE